jgi:hypothetical protein
MDKIDSLFKTLNAGGGGGGGTPEAATAAVPLGRAMDAIIMIALLIVCFWACVAVMRATRHVLAVLAQWWVYVAAASILPIVLGATACAVTDVFGGGGAAQLHALCDADGPHGWAARGMLFAYVRNVVRGVLHHAWPGN